MHHGPKEDHRIAQLRILFLSLCLFFGAWAAGPARAEAASGHISVSLLASTSGPRPGGSFTIGLRLVPDPGWHSYWSNPGGSGLAPTIEWQAPRAMTFGPLQHPAPKLLSVMGITSYVHEGEHVLLSRARLGSSIAPGTALPVEAQVHWLACSASLCVPGHATLHLDLVAGDGSPSAAAPLLGKAEQQLPHRVAEGTFADEQGKLVLRLPTSIRVNAATLIFFPDRNNIIDPAAERARLVGGAVQIAAPVSRASFDLLSGVLSDGRNAYRISFRRSQPAVPLQRDAVARGAPAGQAMAEDIASSRATPSVERPRAPVVSAAGPVNRAPSLFGALLAAVIGGLLLNLMPCVFPVLSIKAIALARAGTSQRAARRDALAYMAGAVAACGALGLLIMVLRLAGDDVGWSFQLQHPAVTLALALLVTAITLNLAGVFELRGVSLSGAPPKSGSAWASMGAGALTAFVATPCSGPFMAAALGATLVLPPAMSLAIFAGLGLGLSLPMLAVALVPGVRNALPTPGPWMEKFRRWMALPTGLAGLALIWLLDRQAGHVAAAEGALVILLVGGSLWWIGARQKRGEHRLWSGVVPLAAAAAGLILVAPAANRVDAMPRSFAVQRFSEARLEQLRRKDVPVLVDITADWCLTCKINERVAIDRGDTRAAFREAGIVTLRGDWTNGDPAITRFLASHGRNSIPFYLFYPAGKEGQLLPQLLSAESLRKLAETAAEEHSPAGPGSSAT